MTEYTLPVAELLERGQQGLRGDWPDYVEEHSFGESHVPDLIRMAQDADLMWGNPLVSQTYAPIHAWRTLGQLRAREAIEPLLTLLHEYDDVDWAGEEIPRVLAMIGPAAVPHVRDFLSNPVYGVYPRAGASTALRYMAEQYPNVTTHITTSGGLLSSTFIENVRELRTRQPGTGPETFALPWRDAPNTPDDLEDDIATAWELLLERWDAIRAEFDEMDVSTVRERWLLPLFTLLDFDPVYQRGDTVLGEERDEMRFLLTHCGWEGGMALPYSTYWPRRRTSTSGRGETHAASRASRHTTCCRSS